MAVKPEKTGEVVGFLMSGLLVGILLSTSIAGLLSDLFHWKTIYILSGIIMLALSFYLKGKLPSLPRLRISYAAIFKSMAALLKQEPRLVLRSLTGACAFAAMSMLFSTIALLLTQEPFQLSDVWSDWSHWWVYLARFPRSSLVNGPIVAISKYSAGPAALS